MALLVTWNAQAQQVLGAIHMAPLKLPRRHSHILRDAVQIVLGQVNEALLLAAVGAAGLALESKRHHAVVPTIIIPLIFRNPRASRRVSPR
jgi:hypothetical protein